MAPRPSDRACSPSGTRRSRRCRSDGAPDEPLARCRMRSLRRWLAVAWIGFLVLPWYALEDGLLGGAWPADFVGAMAAPALLQALLHGRGWLLTLAIPLALATAAASGRPRLGVFAGALGLAVLLVEGFAITHRGWGFEVLVALTGSAGPHQPALGWGALAFGLACLMLITGGLAARGWCRGDAFITGAIGSVLAAILLFIGFPVAKILIGAFPDSDRAVALTGFVERLLDASLWGTRCLGGGSNCGVAWHTPALALVVATGRTPLGLA